MPPKKDTDGIVALLTFPNAKGNRNTNINIRTGVNGKAIVKEGKNGGVQVHIK